MKNKFFYGLVYVLYILTIIVGLNYCSYRLYIKKYIPPNLATQKLSKSHLWIGPVLTDKKSCFTNFEKQKNENTVRIGCFGDSFTYGTEVDSSNDYPSWLQNIFNNKEEYGNVEVLNFGFEWFGFHQSHILWENLGKEYNLDYILLGPQCFQHNRDSSFNHAFFEMNAYKKYIMETLGSDDISFNAGQAPALHSRYILNDNTVKKIDVIGETPHDVISHYFRFIPHRQYLRYDRQTPAFLAAPIDFLLPNKSLKRNPFYYKKDIQKEMNTIYKILLAQMADTVSGLILGNYDENIVQLGQEMNHDHLIPARLYQPAHFPYKAFGGHNSPNGNHLLAQQMFALLTNKKESIVTILQTEDVLKSTLDNAPVAEIPLNRLEKLEIEINDTPVGLIQFTAQPIQPMSLLAIQNKDKSMCDAIFLPLDFELTDNMPLTMRVENKHTTQEYPLGTVKLLQPNVNIGSIAFNNEHFDVEIVNVIGRLLFDVLMKIRTREQSPHNILFNRGDTVTLALKDGPLLIAHVTESNEDLKFRPTNQYHQLALLRAYGHTFIDIKKLPPTGLVYLSLYSAQEKVARLPFARWSKIIKTIPFEHQKDFTPVRTMRKFTPAGNDKI